MLYLCAHRTEDHGNYYWKKEGAERTSEAL